MGTNNFVGIGNLTRDPETRYTQGANPTTICQFGIAINDSRKNPQTGAWEDEPTFLNIVVFGKKADNCAQYLAKGKKVCVTGRVKTGQYTNQQGVKVNTTDIIASNVEFLTPSGQQDQFAQQSGFGQQNGFGQTQAYTNPQTQQFGAQAATAPQQGFGQQQAQGFGQPQQMQFGQQPPAQTAPPQQQMQQPAPAQAQPAQGFTALTDDDVPF